MKKTDIENLVKDMKKKVNTLLTIHEVASILQVHTQTVRKLDRKGILQAVRLREGGPRRYHLEDVERYVLERKEDIESMLDNT